MIADSSTPPLESLTAHLRGVRASQPRVTLAQAQAQAARALVGSQISRADVAGQLQSLGLTPQAAKDRVAALTDSEVATLAGQIQSLPAGADGTALVVLILIGVLIWWLVK